MRRHRAFPALPVLLAVLACAPLAAAGPGAVPSVVLDESVSSRVLDYPVLDARGRPAGSAPWRVVQAGGNCCEVFVDATADGQLLELGGERPWFSADRGTTWRSARALPPFVLGEGAVTGTPDGDAVGVTWDYSQGDRLTAFRQDRRAGTWQSQEIPSRGLGYERPHLSVVSGPFTVDGRTVPWVAFATAPYSFEPDVVLASTDGLDYRPTSWLVDSRERPPVVSWLDRTRRASADWTQGHPLGDVVPLGAGAVVRVTRTYGYLRSLAPTDCTTYVLRPPDLRWSCLRLPSGRLPEGALVADSRGRLHTASFEGDAVTVATSPDGARTWHPTRFRVAGGGTVLDLALRAHGRLGRTAVQLHVRRPDGRSVVQVAVLDSRGSTARLLRTYQVGAGDARVAVGVQEALDTGYGRWDFPSFSFLPDGSLVAAFVDAAHQPPALAVLQRPA